MSIPGITSPANQKQPSFAGQSKPGHQHTPAVKLGVKGMSRQFSTAAIGINPWSQHWHTFFQAVMKLLGHVLIPQVWMSLESLVLNQEASPTKIK